MELGELHCWRLRRYYRSQPILSSRRPPHRQRYFPQQTVPFSFLIRVTFNLAPEGRWIRVTPPIFLSVGKTRSFASSIRARSLRSQISARPRLRVEKSLQNVRQCQPTYV